MQPDPTPDAVLAGNDFLATFGHTYPRATAAITFLFGLLVVVGVVCAQIDTEKLRAKGWLKMAGLIDRGAEVGAFAIALLGSRKGKP